MPPPYDPAGGGGDDTDFGASSCVTPAGAAGSGVEVAHAAAAVTNTTPTVSSFKRVLMAFPICNDGDANHRPHSSSTNDNP